MISPRIDGRLQLSRMLMPYSARIVMVRHSSLLLTDMLMTEYAAAFFMLADQPKDAISVCLRQMGDWQLAIALAKAIEPDSNGPLLKWILTDRVVPMAFEGGHRWLASWAFWTLGRRDLAVRVLIVSLPWRRL